MNALLLLLGSLLSLLPSHHEPRPAAGRRQPLPAQLVLMHGRGEHTDSATFRRDVLAALREGAAAAGLGDRTVTDVRVVWYADLLGGRDASGSDAERRECERGAGPPAPLGMLTVFAGSLLDLADSDSGSGSGSGSAGDSTDADVRDRRALRGMLGDLRFLSSPQSRCIAENRLARTLADAGRGGRPVVLIAHSMGGLISWRHLQARPARGAMVVDRYVTVGSPVGSPAIRELLLGERGSDAVSLPRGVTAWINILNPADPFALPLHDPLAPPAPEIARTVRDIALPERATDRTHDNADAHALLRYLAAPETARAIFAR